MNKHDYTPAVLALARFCSMPWFIDEENMVLSIEVAKRTTIRRRELPTDLGFTDRDCANSVNSVLALTAAFASKCADVDCCKTFILGVAGFLRRFGGLFQRFGRLIEGDRTQSTLSDPGGVRMNEKP